MKHEISIKQLAQNYCIISGITYSQTPYWFPFYNNKDLKMDIIRPFGLINKKLPVIVWVCGGAWLTMDRSAHLPNLMYFAKQGYIIASVEYRMSNCAQFPSQLVDIKSAIRYLRKNADTYGVFSEKIIIMGESAGGYLSAMTGATNNDKLYDEGENLEFSSNVNAVVDYYGPVNFLANLENPSSTSSQNINPISLLLGYEPTSQLKEAKKAGVLSHINENTPPFFILHGKADQVVPYTQSEQLYDTLTKYNVPCEYYLIEEGTHASAHFYQDYINEKILSFINII